MYCSGLLGRARPDAYRIPWSNDDYSYTICRRFEDDTRSCLGQFRVSYTFGRG